MQLANVTSDANVVTIASTSTLRQAIDRLIEAGADAVEIHDDGARVQRFTLRELVTARISASAAAASAP